jgi:hypothetical protein
MRNQIKVSQEQSMTANHARMLSRLAIVATAGTLAVAGATSGFARDRGGAIAAGVAAGALVGAAAASVPGYYGAAYYGAPYDSGPIYASDSYPTGVVDWGNTNSIGPNRDQMEHAD